MPISAKACRLGGFTNVHLLATGLLDYHIRSDILGSSLHTPLPACLLRGEAIMIGNHMVDVASDDNRMDLATHDLSLCVCNGTDCILNYTHSLSISGL